MKKCIVCAGSGWMPVRGKSRFDGLEVSGVRECLCKALREPIVASAAACRTCGDHGIYGGELYGQYAGAWKFCACSAGHDLQQREPSRAAAANIAREKLIRRFGGKPIQAMLLDLADGDAYHGDF